MAIIAEDETNKGGKIASAVWNGAATSECSVQAKAVEDCLVKTQDIGFSKHSDAEGRADNSLRGLLKLPFSD